MVLWAPPPCTPYSKILARTLGVDTLRYDEVMMLAAVMVIWQTTSLVYQYNVTEA